MRQRKQNRKVQKMNNKSTDKVLKDEEAILRDSSPEEFTAHELAKLAGDREINPKYYDKGPDGCEEW